MKGYQIVDLSLPIINGGRRLWHASQGYPVT